MFIWTKADENYTRMDTHIRTVGHSSEQCIDARVQDIGTLKYLIGHHMIGGFFNSSEGQIKYRQNSRYEGVLNISGILTHTELEI